MLERVDSFSCRTGLFDYAHCFRICAFFAREPSGEKQVEYLKRAPMDVQLDIRVSRSREDLSAAPNNIWGPSNLINAPKDLCRRYEDESLNHEGARGR